MVDHYSDKNLIDKARKDGIYRINVAAVMLNDKEEVLLCRRSMTKKVRPGLWHFPGGKVEKDEGFFDAIRREIKEELDIDVSDNYLFTEEFHDYGVDAKLWRTYFFVVEGQGKVKLNSENDKFAWADGQSIGNYRNDELESLYKRLYECALNHKIVSRIS